MSRFHQRAHQRDADAAPSASGRSPRPSEDEGASRWQSTGPLEPASSAWRKAVAAAMALLLVPLGVGLWLAIKNGEWGTDQVRYHIERGKTLSLEEKLDEARAEFEEALRLDPNSAEAIGQIGSLDMEREDYVGCEREARKALALAPDEPWLLTMLGIARNQQGDEEEAFRCYERSIAVSPTYSYAHKNIANLLAKRGEFGRAIAELKLYLRYEPNADDVDEVNDLISRLEAAR